ncbi:Ribosome maturation protein SBDS [Pseudolycoriella hygida]|uniref:Ribosome maturation protein SBDS n=1 Tax=Pseudolycoriella hygida TaxID=35572 RepID=A0A9Q0MZ69_9DIPT|nr:Ribosome maturation protein SBDS [Pseudolycoriella hygida]
MPKIFTPTNQIRLTNVAIVRLKKHGKRFELACYKNKVLSWRNNIEKDIDEVLQTHSVFVNVSKGELAKNNDLEAAFGTTKVEVIIREILEKGELQVSEKERNSQLDSMFKDIATNITDKCVNPESNRPYPVSIIEKAMKDIHFSVKTNKSAKQQALEAIPLLKNTIPLERANMRIKVTLTGHNAKKLKERIVPHCVSVAEEDWDNGNLSLIGLIDPGSLKVINEIITAESKSSGRVEVLSLKEVVDSEEVFE